MRKLGFAEMNAFVATAERSSFAKAAIQLGVSRSALSENHPRSRGEARREAAQSNHPQRRADGSRRAALGGAAARRSTVLKRDGIRQRVSATSPAASFVSPFRARPRKR